jgi:hypothetical protein
VKVRGGRLGRTFDKEEGNPRSQEVFTVKDDCGNKPLREIP